MNVFSNKEKFLIFIIGMVQLIISIIFTTILSLVNMLPGRYILIASIIELVLLTITIALQIKGGWPRAIGIILSLLISIVYCIGAVAISSVGNIISEVTKTEEHTDQIVIAVNQDSEKSIYDLQNMTVGVQYTFQPDLMYAVEGKLKNENNILLNKENCITISNQVDKLFNKDVDAIIYNSAYTDLISEQYPDYESKIKIIHTMHLSKDEILKYKNLIEREKKEELEETTKPTVIEKPEPSQTPTEEINQDVFSVYISGIDVYGAITTNSRSDVNIFAVVNPKNHEILLVTTPRDYFVKIPGISGNKKDKLTHAGIYGIDASMNTLEALYGLNLDYYARVNFTSFEMIVDALGGIDVYSEYEFSADGYHYKKGINSLNGKQALRFCRERYSFAAGDNQRGKNQQEAIKAIINKACSTAILTAAPEILNSVKENVDMNIPEFLIQSLIKQQLNDGAKWEIKTMQATGSGSSDEPYSMPGFNAYVMIPNQTSVDAIKSEIKEMYEQN